MQSFFTTINQSTFGGQFAPKMGGQWRAKKGGQFDRNFQAGAKKIFSSFA